MIFISKLFYIFFFIKYLLFLGSFCGSLSPLKASDLGSIVIQESLARAHIKPEDVSEVILGQVISDNIISTCSFMRLCISK